MDRINLSWDDFRRILDGRRLPAAIINLDALDKNIDTLFAPIRPSGKTVRIATKSIRSPEIVKYICEREPELIRGMMCYSVEEAAFCREQGFDDLFVAYPTVQPTDTKLAAEMTKDGAEVIFIVDDESHLDAYSAAGIAAGVSIAVAIDLDVSYRPLGGRIHLGVRRSPVRAPIRAANLARYASGKKGVHIAGLMGYEAQVAGLPDDNPFTKAINPIKKLIRKLSIPAVSDFRAKAVEAVLATGAELRVINGGGSGSVDSTSLDPTVTEVTVGSGFYCPHLFSYYSNIDLAPAAFFALQVVRVSDPGFVTCSGGGYIGSGETGPDRQPLVHLPFDCKLTPLEGGGEVQTPILVGGDAPRIKTGDPIIMRHAKAGELCERFDELLLVRGGEVVGAAPTYRGLGKCFV